MPSEELHAIELLGRVPYGRLATSMRALPFLAVARHIVVGDRILLRMHSGFGYHEACNGSVVAYGADNFNAATPGDGGNLWSVQFTGPAEIVRPSPDLRELFGTAPARVNGEPFEPAFLSLDPHFVSEHTLDFRASPLIRNAA
ncbi:pyridoxamine 5'-phosphate oxidase family protein [Streptomyces sp. NBC_00654]|uniref:pyridoxamine 5'-phosphate oxidase family protein n=1 Tax=Streptomyces sp. NBC_00654 TaxID=2975799 RepID=UPI00224F617C|nr:pyridoxamine 5'-phosphate oxidase family protein [Streptomyces sp. NBC_00654]MCX4963482.1 pyridoxamine 5'-phosphate oxidase family protein [Streptomyces sp. NBC_00654]